VQARVAGAQVVVGRPELLAEPDAVIDAIVRDVQGDGRTAVLVLVDAVAVAVIAMSDRPRPGAAGALAELRRAVGDEPEILTGDAERPARTVAEQVGIHRVHAGLLPGGKVEHVRTRQGEGHRVLAAGDGINDAPLLAAADVGLAVGDGAGGLALEAADGVLTRDPIGALAPLVGLARRARRISRANLALAAAVIVLLVTWDLLGSLPLALGVAGHELSTVIVCLNGLRLLLGHRRAPVREQPAAAQEPAPIGAGERDQGQGRSTRSAGTDAAGLVGHHPPRRF
jgi:P-type E1-E2 ATPase